MNLLNILLIEHKCGSATMLRHHALSNVTTLLATRSSPPEMGTCWAGQQVWLVWNREVHYSFRRSTTSILISSSQLILGDIFPIHFPTQIFWETSRCMPWVPPALSFLIWSLIIFKSTNSEAPHYAVSWSSCYWLDINCWQDIKLDLGNFYSILPS